MAIANPIYTIEAARQARRAGQQEFRRVHPALNAAHADQRHARITRHLPIHQVRQIDRHGANRRARQAARSVGQAGAALRYWRHGLTFVAEPSTIIQAMRDAGIRELPAPAVR